MSIPSSAAAPASTPSATPTLVTAVFDLGRERLTAPFHRDADHYRRHLPAVLAIDLPMVVYCDSKHVELVRSLRGPRPTVIHPLEPAQLTAHPLYQPVQQIRRNPQWLAQADWLPLSPQAALPDYNPLVMSKPIWLYEQAQRNPFGSTHYYWIDAGISHTVPAELLQAASFIRLAQQHRRFLLLCYPHDPEREVHGFDAAALAQRAGVERTRWVARGGFFGGASAYINDVAARYSHHLEQTLAQGLMGTEESILTVQSYAEAELFDLQFIGRDGLVWPFFRALAGQWPGDLGSARQLQAELSETWFVSYNTPLQFQRLLESITAADPALLRTARRVLINNSTDAVTFAHYDALCAQYGIEQIREGNRGINGARIHAADLFHRSGRHAQYWFEDDMLLVRADEEPAVCDNGLSRHVHETGATSLAVLQREFADYVKFSFTEVYGSHHSQWGWINLNDEARAHYFPGAIDAPRTGFYSVQSLNHVPYAVGEVYYSNWPQVVTRRGTHRLFFDERREPCYEQYWTARSFELLRLGHVKAAVLLASPVNHHRTDDYARVERVEYQRLEDAAKPITPATVAPPAPVPAPAARRDWPLQPGTIFVSIANYRDSETPHTIRSLLANASWPQRIRIGVFSQVVPGEDDDCLPPQDLPAGQLREIRCHANDSLGACWARSRILEELLQGEEYVLQIDSHMRFEPGWDGTLLDMLRRCPTPQALITTYPPAYVPPAERGSPAVTLLAADTFNDMGILMVKPRAIDPREPLAGPPPSAFLSANLLFGPATAFRKVPYDPHLYFHGEEISMAARFWTHGWDLYAPDRCVMYHDYSTDRGRRRHWEDKRDWVRFNMRSFARLRHLFGIETSCDPVVLRVIDQYGLGSVRSLADYEAYADVDFKASRIGSRAADARFPAPPAAQALLRLKQQRAHFFERAPGEDTYTPVRETRCGEASTLVATDKLRPALANWLREHGIRRLADAGCGDFNWMGAVDLGELELYAGYDLVPEIIERNQQLYGDRRGHFFTVADITTTPIAACDAILCRHVLEQLSEEDRRSALANFLASGARWLLTSLPVGDLIARESTAPTPVPAAVLPDGESGLSAWDLGRTRARPQAQAHPGHSDSWIGITPELAKAPVTATGSASDTGMPAGHRFALPESPQGPDAQARIFVSVANYRDSETPHTLRDLFAKASRPERIYAGVFSQVVPGEDDDCLPPPDLPAGQIRELRCHPADSMGACWARSRILSELLGDEEYVLQIDSHSRFEPGWDDRLIVMMLACPTPRAVLSSYPNAYTPPDTLCAPSISTIAAEKINQVGVLGLRARHLQPEAIPPSPQPGAFISAGCLFAPAAALREVPYDPYLYFNGEEFSMAVRLWTHGWDIHALNLPVMYHDYENKRGRHRHWDDHQHWPDLDRRCYARLRHLFGIEPSDDPVALREIDRYGLGKQRTLAEYEEYVDVHFASRRTGPRATHGYFPPPMTDEARSRLRRARATYLMPDATPDRVFAAETRDGPLADLAATRALRTELSDWLKKTGVRRLVDAGCGTFHWLAHADLDMLDCYIGCDILPEVIDANQRLHGHRGNVLFALKDVVSSPLPACDAILCRNLLYRMPADDVLETIMNFRASGARWLIASMLPGSHEPGPEKDDPLVHLNSTAAGLGEPVATLADDNHLSLGVWVLND